MQPIRTKFGRRGQVKGQQRSGNFRGDWPFLEKLGLGQVEWIQSFFVW